MAPSINPLRAERPTKGLTTDGPSTLRRRSTSRIAIAKGSPTASPSQAPLDEAIRRLVRAAQLTQDAPVIVGMRVRVLMQAGRGDEALALRDSLKARSAHEFIAAGVLLQGARLDSGGEAALQSLLEANIAEETGPVAILTTLLPELQPLLQHPSLGSLVRQLSPWSAQVN